MEDALRRREFLRRALAAAALPQALAAERARAEPVPPGREGTTSDVWVEVKLGNVAWNLARIRRAAGGRPVMAVLKANGYGHGVAGLARHLAPELHGILVNHLGEVAQLAQANLGVPILHFGALSQPDEADFLVRNDVAQALYSAETLGLLRAAGARLGKSPAAHLVVDTGLGRLGVPHREAMRFIETVKGLDVRGTMTTFTYDADFAREQLRAFNAVLAQMRSRRIRAGTVHAAASDAILNLPESHFDMVRPGIMLYGHYPTEAARQKKEIDLRAAATWKARVAYVKTLQPGDTVGYTRAYRAEREETVATLPVGYADGHRPALAGKADVWLNGRRCPIVAPITANHTIVRVPPDLAVKPGDEAELMGPNIPAHELANHAGISVYQMVIGLSAARPRVYVA